MIATLAARACVVFSALSLTACAASQTSAIDSTVAKSRVDTVAAAPGPLGSFTAEEIEWTAFHPEQPEGLQVYPIKGNPQAGPSVVLFKAPAGWKAPLHAHSSAYVGVTMSDGVAYGINEQERKLLPKMTSWVQPAGRTQVTGCQSETPCLFLVSFRGKVDMRPAKTEAEGVGQPRETMGDAIPWKAMGKGEQAPKMFAVDGDPEKGPFDALVTVPAGWKAPLHTHPADLALAVISGNHHRGPSAGALKPLGPGGVAYEAAGAAHMEKCAGPEPCVFFVRMEGALKMVPVQVKSD